MPFSRLAWSNNDCHPADYFTIWSDPAGAPVVRPITEFPLSSDSRWHGILQEMATVNARIERELRDTIVGSVSALVLPDVTTMEQHVLPGWIFTGSAALPPVVPAPPPLADESPVVMSHLLYEHAILGAQPQIYS